MSIRNEYFQKQQMVEKVVDLGGRIQHRFSEGTLAPELIGSLSNGVEVMYEQLAVQNSAKGTQRSSRNARIAAREALRGRLERIGQTARAMSLDQFFLPRAVSLRALLSTAESWIQQAGPFEQQFVRHGLPAQFIVELRQAIQNLKDARNEETRSRTARHAAAENYRKTLEGALADLDRFEALVRNQLQDDPAVMAEWEIARKVNQPPGRSRKKGAASPSTQQEQQQQTAAETSQAAE
jgi:hypothetical protein